MKTLYSSSFITIILAFLMILGSNGQSVVLDSETQPPSFTTVQEIKTSAPRETVLIEAFENLACPKCRDFALQTLPALRQLEKETGQVELHLYFIPDINDEQYFNAALSLKCAADQNHYWDMLSKIHEENADLDLKSLTKNAKEFTMDPKAFQNCVTEKTHQDSVLKDLQYASEKNIETNPSLLIDNYLLTGHQPFENIQRIINRLLQEKTKKIETPTPADATGLQKELETPVSPEELVPSPGS